MEIALPWRQAAVVGRPNGLQGDRRRAAARGRAELVGFEVPLLLEHGIGQADRRPGPESLPPGRMRLEVAGERPLESPGGRIRGQLVAASPGDRPGLALRIRGAHAPGPGEHPVVRHVPVDRDLVAHPAPALLVVAHGGLVGRELGFRVAQAGQRSRGEGVRGAVRPGGRRDVGGRHELRSLPGRPALELEPADGLRGVDEDGEPRPVRPPHPADGLGQGQANGLDLAQPGDVELEGRGRDLGRRGIAVVGGVAHPVDRLVVVLQDVVADPGEPELGSGELGHRAEVPEVGPVERQPEGIALLPDERADHAVAQGDPLVPGRGQPVEDEIMARGGKRVLLPRRRARGREGERREKGVGASAGLSFMRTAFPVYSARPATKPEAQAQARL